MSLDKEVERLRQARNSPSVLKLRLARLRSELPEIVVFAFEGDDDTIIYAHWINRLRPELRYEPFPCNGKEGVLQLMDVVRRDLSGDAGEIYYFVDRDFDDLRGRPSDRRIFVTDCYSVDNYLVSGELLECLLKGEFHCHGKPSIRGSIRAQFESDFESFLDIASSFNERLYLAKKLGIRSEAPITSKIAHLSQIDIGSVLPGAKLPIDVIKLSREPGPSESESFLSDFAKLDRRKRYRGKFNLLFFCKWLAKLADAHQGGNALFAGVDSASKPRRGEITLGGLASKSTMPKGLAPFLSQA